ATTAGPCLGSVSNPSARARLNSVLRPDAIRPTSSIAPRTSVAGRRLEGRGTRQARGPALGRDHQSHLPGRLVDHLVAEHGRSAVPGCCRGVPLVGVGSRLGPVAVVLAGTEDLVGRIALPSG